MNERLVHALKDAVLRLRRGLALAEGVDLEELLEQAAAEIERMAEQVERFDDHFETCPFSH